LFGDFADLAFAAFAQHDAIPGTFIGAFKRFNPGGCSHFAIELNAFAPNTDIFGIEWFIEQNPIFFFDFEARMGQAEG
jgi:hypothetical protein